MLKVVGAGFARTGTNSLKLALERLLGQPCYHMSELLAHPEHIPLWSAAARGASIDWSLIFERYIAAVDWPSSAFWPELSKTYPDSVIILSHRDAQSWWGSASSTIFPQLRQSTGAWRSMIDELCEKRFTQDLTNRQACIEAFNRHNELVRNADLGHRLVEWEPGQGWEPLCRALDVKIPSEPFPHVNSTADFIEKHL